MTTTITTATIAMINITKRTLLLLLVIIIVIIIIICKAQVDFSCVFTALHPAILYMHMYYTHTRVVQFKMSPLP